MLLKLPSLRASRRIWRWSSRRVRVFFSSRRRHTRLQGDWSSDVCSSDLVLVGAGLAAWWVHAPTTTLTLPTVAMLLFIAGVAVLVRPLVPALAGQVLRPAARSRATLRLAAGELQRSPSRTAYTVGAVVLALALVLA